MGQNASSDANNVYDLRRHASTKERQSKNRQSVRSLPDAVSARSTCSNGGVPISTSAAKISSGHQANGRHVNGSSGGHSTAENEHRYQEQTAAMRRYLHRDAAPYFVSSKPKTTNGPASVEGLSTKSWGEHASKNARRYAGDAGPGCSNWSDVASDMFRISKHRPDADQSMSDVQSDFVTANCHHHRSLSKKQRKRTDKKVELENGCAIGDESDFRYRRRYCDNSSMTPVPEVPQKEQIYREQMENWRRDNGGNSKRSKSMHDCSRRQRPAPPRPPKNNKHYYAHLESEAAAAGGLPVAQWIDSPPSPSNEADQQPQARLSGSSECTKVFAQSLLAEISVERRLRAELENRCKSNEEELKAYRNHVQQLDGETKKLNDAMEESKKRRIEESLSAKQKLDELTERFCKLSEELRRADDEKRRMKEACDQQRETYDDVSNRVAHDLAQEKENRTRLQKRLLEVEWENKVLHARLRLNTGETPVTPTWNAASRNTLDTCRDNSNGNKTVNKNGTHRHDAATENNNNVNVMFRPRGFREKTMLLQKYRQSVGSDPTLDQSGHPNHPWGPSIESGTSYLDEHQHFTTMNDGTMPDGEDFCEDGLAHGGEALCSRPTSLSFDPAASGKAAELGFCHLERSLFIPPKMSLTNQFNEEINRYANTFEEERPESHLLRPPVGLMNSGNNNDASTPIFGTLPCNNNNPRNTGINVKVSEPTNKTATNGFLPMPHPIFETPKRKSDVVVNMLMVDGDFRQMFDDKKRKMGGGLEKYTATSRTLYTPTIRDDGYSTMSSELYAVLDSSLAIRSELCVDAGSEKSRMLSSDWMGALKTNGIKPRRSLSDGQLNSHPTGQPRLIRRTHSAGEDWPLEGGLPNFCANDDDDDDDDQTVNEGEESAPNREALCDFEGLDLPYDCIQKPSIFENFDWKPSISSPDNTPLCIISRPANSSNNNNNDKPRPGRKTTDTEQRYVKNLSSIRKRSQVNSSSGDSSDDDDGNSDTTLTVSRRRGRTRRTTPMRSAENSASSTSTSFTSDEERRFDEDEGTKTTMQLWLKQLKVKSAGQKSGLVRYLPPERRPSILPSRRDVFSGFGNEERRALASFDFLKLRPYVNCSTATERKRSQSETDLYENFTYHQRTESKSKNITEMANLGGSQLSCCTNSGSRLTLVDPRASLGRNYCSSLYLSDFCNADNLSSSSSNSSLSFTLD